MAMGVARRCLSVRADLDPLLLLGRALERPGKLVEHLMTCSVPVQVEIAARREPKDSLRLLSHFPGASSTVQYTVPICNQRVIPACFCASIMPMLHPTASSTAEWRPAAASPPIHDRPIHSALPCKRPGANPENWHKTDAIFSPNAIKNTRQKCIMLCVRPA